MIRPLELSDERSLRLWMLQHDPEFAFHPQLKNYFLADTEQFGAIGVFDHSAELLTATTNQPARLVAVAFYSRFNGIAYLHHYMGGMVVSSEVVEFLGDKAEIFLRTIDGQEQQLETGLESWTQTLVVQANMVVDHPAYSGAFWRTIPRYPGIVYRKGC